jgi:tyrosine-protein kinase Etk/Wzc
MAAFASKAVRGGIDDPQRIEALLGAGAVHAAIPHSPAQDRLRPRPRPWLRARTQTQTQAGGRGASAPASGLASALVLARAAPDDAAAEGLRAFRAALQFALPYNRNNVISCLGPTRRVGASFVSVNLALLMAAGGQRTLLIDADLRAGRLHDYFGVDCAGGLAECLAGELPPHAALRRNVADRLDFIARGGALPHQTELLQHRSLAGLLEALGADYDVVLMTAPPVMAAADALIVGAHAGAVFLVARAGLTTEAELEAAVKRLNRRGAARRAVQRCVSAPERPLGAASTSLPAASASAASASPAGMTAGVPVSPQSAGFRRYQNVFTEFFSKRIEL